jgi:uncharacterized phage protein gp47/JayE
MATTRTDLALQMIAQLRLLDPSVSADLGTPERKIIDTVASALYDDQVDLDALSTGLDVDGKYGSQLDRFLNIFGFTRQQATPATGFVTFSRLTASATDIRVPIGTSIRASGIDEEDSPSEVRFATTFDVILPAGALSVVAPIRCVTSGTIGNLAAGRINEVVGTTLYGITSVTNELPTANGINDESDAEFKVRFKNTVFRNLAGTQDQYMALAAATAFTTRANVVGPQSHYREYIQVPWVDDSQSYNIDGLGGSEAGGGNAGEYTTALSTIPYAKYLWSSNPVFVSSAVSGADLSFFRQDSDFRFNTTNTDRDRGDTHRQLLAGTGVNPTAGIWPNITFTNVYTGSNADVQAVSPGDVLLLEYSYLSDASRNDPTLGITNAVDVYIDGGNDTDASTITVRPTSATAFVDNANSKYHYENYRRTGSRVKRPIIGNLLMPTFWQPTTAVPDQIVVDTDTYFKDVHYWAITDWSNLSGTIRARNGLEWSSTIKGKAAADALGDPSSYTGKLITDTTGDPVGGHPIEIESYTYDKNIVDLQSALEGAKQVTTDVLAHKAKIRYFKLDITVMYTPGSNVPSVNQAIRDSVDQYLRGLYFGSTIQLSDLLQVIHSVSGVDNVRWSTDTPNSTDLARVFEVEDNGTPLTNVTVDRIQPGIAGIRPEIQGIYVTGQPTSGTFWIAGSASGAAGTYADSAATWQTALRTATGDASLTVAEDTRSTTGVRNPIRSFRVTYSTNAAKLLPIISDLVLIGGPFIINSDFYLRDDELSRLASGTYTPQVGHTPADGLPDTVPGLIIRPRAQNTWTNR